MPEWERLVNNYQLSEHLRCVQELLDHCKVSVGPEPRFDGEITHEWYRSYKAANMKPAIYDLLCQPLTILRNGNEFTPIDAGRDKAQTATETLVKINDIVKEGTLLLFCQQYLLIAAHFPPHFLRQREKCHLIIL